MRKRQCDPLRKFMIKPRANIIGDKVTPQQRRYLNRHKGMKRFGDWDKDGVINGLDCQPRNPRKHRFESERDLEFKEHFEEKGYYRYKATPMQMKDDLPINNLLNERNDPINKFIKYRNKNPYEKEE